MKKIFLLAILITNMASNITSAEELTREFCREKASEEQVIKCIQEKIWDPCEEGASGSSFWGAQCGWAHNTIAEYRIKKTEEEIKRRLQGSPEKEKALNAFILAEEHWNNFRKSYCEFSSAVSDFSGFNDNISRHLAYCLRRLAGEHSEELDSMLAENVAP